MTVPRLVARDVTRVYRGPAGNLRVLDRLSFEADAGTWTVVTGRSGSGKSTLLSVLGGFEVPDEGDVVWSVGAQPVRSPGSPPPWAAVAVVPQALGLLDELPVAEAIALPLRLLGVGTRERQRRVGELLERLGLQEVARRRPEETSLGEQQRTTIARAAVVDPAVLLLDEPTAHLDARSAASVLDLLDERRHRGGAVVVATHDPAIAEAADRRLRLDEGRLIEGR